MTVIHDFRKRDYIRASQLYSMKIAAGYEPGLRYLEIPPDICTNICGASETLEPRFIKYLYDQMLNRSIFNKDTLSTVKGLFERQIIYRRLQLPSFKGNGLIQKDSDTDQYLQTIDAYYPSVVKALPTYLYILARRIKAGGKRPRIKNAIMPMGASMSAKMKSVIESAFGTYSSA
jgi:phenylacetate-CoA ligase